MATALKSRGAALVALLLSTAATARAHEHHMDNIPEGDAVSPDPIVRHGEKRVDAQVEC